MNAAAFEMCRSFPRPGLKLQRMSVIGSIPGLLSEPGPPQNDEDVARFSRLLKAETK